MTASELKQRLIARIHSLGPLTVADYMTEALAARDGYYRSGDPLGAAGDFTTAPEISQMYGELIGAWLAERWQALGAPSPVMLVELGPGRGTLLADALRATRQVPGFHGALDLHLVEINATLRDTQAKAIAATSQIAPQIAPRWHAGFADLPDSTAPLLLVANEFFDALPIRQLQRGARGWHERLIAADDGGLRFVLAPGPSPLAALLPGGATAAPDTIAELSPASLALMQIIAERIARTRGAALIVDYGRATPWGASLQAVAHHRRAEPLENPGAADLSALVDFSALAQVARQAGAAVFGPVGQGAFLRALGIDMRATVLKTRADTVAAAAIDAALVRLIAPEQMGTLFQVLAVTDDAQSAPAGFA